MKTIMETRLIRFLDEETERLRDVTEEIMFIEKQFEDRIALACGPMAFVYRVDRVDRFKDGTIMIIDYKTGSRDVMPKAIDKIATLPLSRVPIGTIELRSASARHFPRDSRIEAIRDNVISFQVPLYFHYLNKQFKDRPINAALYNLRTSELKTFIGDRPHLGVCPPVPSREQIDAVFMRALDFVFAEILDPKVPFVEEEEV